MERKYGRKVGKRMLLWGLIGILWMQVVFHALVATVHASVPQDIAQFPESYQASLMALKAKHPNWTFVPVNTVDWNTAIKNEMRDGKSLVYKSFPGCAKEGAYDQGNWFFASKAVLEYYMDPRNSLTENAIFQFEQLSYNEQYHTLTALESFLSGTFMGNGKKVPNTSMSYPLLIHACGSHPDVCVSPFHLAARILQEQGAGNSALISGTYPGYEGYYNYFNIGATGTTNKEVIENGLKYAKEHWGKALGSDPEQGAYNAIWGGANFIASGYIKRGQNTLYLQKYNVTTNTPYTHQYMQNISAPTTEAKSIKGFYASANALDSPFVFQIPVYKNMPQQACPMPTVSTNIVLEISSDPNDPYNYTKNTVMVDGVEYEGESYYNSAKKTRRLIVTLPDGNAKRASIEIKDSRGQLRRGYYWDLSYQGTYYVATVGTAPEPEPEPVVPTNDVTLELPAGISATEVWLDGVSVTGTMDGGKLTVTAADDKAKTAVVYVYNESGVPVDTYVWTLRYGKEGYEAVLQPELQGLLSYHGFSIRITGKSGIRFKSGIAISTREKLLGEGINGYHLKEYGTVVMNQANRAAYPMVLGGEKTVSGTSYGIQADGSLVDTVFETVSDRYRFTSVLVGLPSDQYKTEFAFRGYVILEKDGEEITLYGPAVARSIYSLAEQLLDMHYYEEGSDADLFLKQLIRVADGQVGEEDPEEGDSEKQEDSGEKDSEDGNEEKQDQENSENQEDQGKKEDQENQEDQEKQAGQDHQGNQKDQDDEEDQDSPDGRGTEGNPSDQKDLEGNQPIS